LRIRDQDVVILGGLEVDSKSNSGSGVPFLAKIPLIKWLFSKRVRTAQKSKLSVLIKPSIIRAE
jgi:type IV pilus assembly protein PilQ